MSHEPRIDLPAAFTLRFVRAFETMESTTVTLHSSPLLVRDEYWSDGESVT